MSAGSVSGGGKPGRRHLPVTAGRAEGAELQRLAAEAERNPLFHALLEWIDGAVVILNRQRQIVLASPELAELVGSTDASNLIGRRYGEALGCTHVADGIDGCGSSRSCQYCGALRTIVKGQRLDEPVESECRITLRGERGSHSVKYQVRAAQAAANDHPGFLVMVLRRADHATQVIGSEPATEPEEPEWPSDVLPTSRLRRLGIGAMGSVFLVLGSDGREYALKTIRPERAADRAVVDRFYREMQIAQSLRHANIVETYRTERTSSGTLYMLSEFCPNGSAGRWLQVHGSPPPDLALWWLIGTARAIEYAWHEHRLVHRDIKPDNLLLDTHNRVKVTDFGVAKRINASDLKLTVSGLVIGSIPYMAPEQALGVDEVDTRADLYSLGVTFYELLSGWPPFDAPTPTAMLTRKITESAPPLAARCPALPPSIAESVDWLLRRERGERPLDAGHFARHLLDVARRENIDLAQVPGRYVGVPIAGG